MIGNDPRQGCFSGSGRSKKDNRRKPVRLNSPPQQPPFSDNVFLSDILVKIPWTHPRGQRQPFRIRYRFK